MMQINTLIQPSVGADLSRTPPIYRPSLDFPSPDENVKKHEQAAYSDLQK